MNEINIREIVKVYLKKNSWSISDMSLFTGIPRSTISEWFSNKRDLPIKYQETVFDFLNNRYIKSVDEVTKNIFYEKSCRINKDYTLSIQEVTRRYLQYNLWSISDMARMIDMPQSTLSEWISEKHKLSRDGVQKVKRFLAGEYFIDVETIRKEVENVQN